LDLAIGGGYLSITATSAASQETTMIATALSIVAHAVGARRAERARSAAVPRTTPTTRTTRVFHPPGAIRLATPAEQDAQRNGHAEPGAASGAADPRSLLARPQLPGPRGQAEDIEMANFGTRLAYPRPEAHERAHAAPLDVTAPAATTGVVAALRRALRSLLHAIDDAPFDLAWPPSYRRWPTNVPAWRSDQPVADVIDEAPRQRRAA
jgi:hypothetical protein